MSRGGEQRRLRWGIPETKTPRHPYRDTLIVYAILALVIVLFGWLTGGDIVRAVVIAIAVFVAATAWSSLSWRRRLQRERAEAAERERRL
jgi:hypothetical protein